MRRLPQVVLLLSAVVVGNAFPLLGETARGAQGDPVLLQGEIQALRAVLDAELEGTDFQRVTIGRFLRLPRDTRRVREEALEALRTGPLAVEEPLLESFRTRNRARVELWASKEKLLGERADKGVMMLENPRQVAVQYGRMGTSPSGDRGLVYLEMRSHERAEKVTAVFRVLESTEEGWRLLPGRSGFERNEFRTTPFAD